ncbi:MAG: DsbA family protein [Leucobacter sp.]
MTNTTEPSQRKRMSTSAKAALITIPIVVVGVIVLIIVLSLGKPAAAPGGGGDAARPGGSGSSAATSPVVAENSHVLSDAGPDAPTLVEFLDFECEACGEIFPVMEELREEYAGEMNFVIRYFPLPGHQNSMTAALAVEAAAQQGKFEEMYKLMFETLGEWGEKRDSEAPRFRGYAEQLGLDMAAYDAALKDPATQQRIEFDFEAGQKLGVSGTPTFFLEGELFQPQYLTDITDAFDAAIAAKK